MSLSTDRLICALALSWLAACGSSRAVTECDPPCGGGTHCTENGCVGDQPDVDMAVPTDLAADCVPACSGATPRCRAGRCVPCVVDDDCLRGQVCKTSGATTFCVTGCSDDARCGGGTNRCCRGGCVDTAKDAANCGGCGMACSAPNALPQCVAGACAPGTCEGGWGDCNNDSSDGCEASLHSDPRNCRGCGQACSVPHGTAGCADGCYVRSCDFGYQDCNADGRDGCELAVSSDVRNCGQCGMQCPPAARAQIACSNGGCLLVSCSAGYADCNGKYGDGCEIALTTDKNNCGMCGLSCAQGQVCTNGECTCPPCVFANAKAACINKLCDIEVCNPGYANCDNNLANGCEQNIGTDRFNCGSCGYTCGQGLVCQNGGCTCPQCNFANAKPACINNVCVLDSCLQGYADCDGKPANGCEVTVQSDNSNCGKCGTVCGGQTPFCQAGICSKVGVHCAAIKNSNPNSQSGVYLIDPDGNGGLDPFSAYCDMTTAGGGWTMVLNLDTSDGNVMWVGSPGTELEFAL